MSVLVTGGTGTSGRALVPALRAAGHDVRVLSRRPGPDRIELVAAGPAGRMIQFGGPQVRPMDELTRAWLRGTGRSRGVRPVPLPGGLARAERASGLTAPDQPFGVRSFEQFLAGSGNA